MITSVAAPSVRASVRDDDEIHRLSKRPVGARRRASENRSDVHVGGPDETRAATKQFAQRQTLRVQTRLRA